jgi:dihydrofolate reductase
MTQSGVRMRRLIYSMNVSLDGYIKGPDGTFDWSVPSEEEHRLHNDHVRELSAHVLGRALYETMRFWDTEEASSSDEPVMRDFAAIWRSLPKIVFSRSLTSVEGANTRLATRDIEAELAELDGDVGVGGAALAAECARRGLIDEYRPFVKPIVLGGGTSFLPPLESPVELRLLETRTFGDGAVYLRFARAV